MSGGISGEMDGGEGKRELESTSTLCQCCLPTNLIPHEDEESGREKIRIEYPALPS